MFRARKKMVQLGTWGYGLCSQYMCVPSCRDDRKLGTWAFGLGSQYMCVPSCRDNRKLGTCLVCLVNLKLGTLVPISSVQAVLLIYMIAILGALLSESLLISKVTQDNFLFKFSLIQSFSCQFFWCFRTETLKVC